MLYLKYMGYHRIANSRAVYDTEDPEDIIEPDVSDVFNLWAEPEAFVMRAAHLTEDVTQADLRTYSTEQLQDRAAYYDRQYTFERGKKARLAFEAEVARTNIELNRRRMYLRKEADRVFEL